jgi:hypothetical protein
MRQRIVLSLVLLCLVTAPLMAQQKGTTMENPQTAPAAPAWLGAASAKLQTELLAKYGDAQRARTS